VREVEEEKEHAEKALTGKKDWMRTDLDARWLVDVYPIVDNAVGKATYDQRKLTMYWM
jgi:hypothetical protein